MSVSAAPGVVAVLTRPQPEADRWCDTLRGAGCVAWALPLIAIEPLTPDPGLQKVRAGLATYDAVFCVSAQAVRCFWGGERPVVGATTRFWAPGPGTARALQTQGVPADRIDGPPEDAAQFDSESLWEVVGPGLRPGHRVLVVRGGGPAAQVGDAGQGRDWLAQRCVAAGAEVEGCVAYRRIRPVWSVTDTARAQQAVNQGAVWVFSSSEAVGHLAVLWPETPWQRLRALATHPRIAQTLRDCGVTDLRTVRPTLPDVLSGLESTGHG